MWKITLTLSIVGGLLFSASICAIISMGGTWYWGLFGSLSLVTPVLMFLYFAIEDTLKKLFEKNDKLLTVIVGIIIVIAFIFGIRFIPSII